MQNFDNVQHILKDIQNTIKSKHNKELKFSEIKEIVNSQFKNIKKYTELEKDIKIDYIGKFKIKSQRRYYLEKDKKNAN